MFAPNPLAARTLESSAADLADAACTLFLESAFSGLNTNGQQPTKELHEEWSHHFRQRVLELSAALAAGEVNLFTSRVRWSRQAMTARLQHKVPLGETLHSLRAAVLNQLPGELSTDALACIDQALRENQDDLPAMQVSQLDPANPEQRLALLYLQDALEGNTRQAIDTVLNAIENGLSHADAICRILLPAQQEIGHLWHLDHVTIAEEHLVTTTTQRLMAVIADRAPTMPSNGKTAVAASVSGNVHDIGIRAITYLLELNGWRAIYLGSDVPRNDLPAAVHFYSADIALLSIALSSQLPKLQQSIATIRQHCDADIKIMVGGNAFFDAPGAWQKIGADAYATDAESALMQADRLITMPVTRH